MFPNEYKKNQTLCCDEFYAYDFPKNELEKSVPGLSDYLKLSFYLPLKKSIQHNSVDDIKHVNHEMNTMGFYLEDFNPNSYVNDWLKGERYVPLIFIALEHRSVSALKCLMELGLPLNGRMYISKSINNNNSRCVSFRTRAEELECFDIIGMINELEDDNELKTIFKAHISSAETGSRQASLKSEQQFKRKSKVGPDYNLNKKTIQNNSFQSKTCVLL